MSIEDALNAGTFEVGARALSGVLDELDGTWAALTCSRLEALLEDGELARAAPEIAAVAEELVLRLGEDGMSGAWSVTGLFHPSPDAVPPSRQGLVDALRLRYAGSRWETLAALIASHAEGDVADYAREVVVPALLEWAAPEDDDAHDDTLAAVELARPVVRALPSRRGSGSYASYEVLPGDTLQDVSEAVLGARDRWPELVRLYGLVPPYLLEGVKRDGVLSPGEKLMLPGTQAIAGHDGSRLGDTLRLTPNGRLELDLTLTPEGDLAIERGLDGFFSDLTLRAMTPLGDLPDEPDYGVAVAAGLPATQAGLVRALAGLDGLYYDTRVGTVSPVARAGTSARHGVIVGDVVVTPRPDLTAG